MTIETETNNDEQGSDDDGNDEDDGDDDAGAGGATGMDKGGVSTPCSFTGYDDQYIVTQDSSYGNRPKPIIIAKRDRDKSKAPTHTQHYDGQTEYKGYGHGFYSAFGYGIFDDQYFRSYDHRKQISTNEVSSSSNLVSVFRSSESEASTSQRHTHIRDCASDVDMTVGVLHVTLIHKLRLGVILSRTSTLCPSSYLLIS